MKTTFKFITNAAQAALVFLVIFIMPAVMITIIWLDLSIYKACVTNPSYCAVMFVFAGIVTHVYSEVRAERCK